MSILRIFAETFYELLSGCLELFVILIRDALVAFTVLVIAFIFWPVVLFCQSWLKRTQVGAHLVRRRVYWVFALQFTIVWMLMVAAGVVYVSH